MVIDVEASLGALPSKLVYHFVSVVGNCVGILGLV